MSDSTMITVRLTDDVIKQIDEAVERGDFKSRAAAIKQGLKVVLKQSRDKAIVEEFRAAYETFPINEEDKLIGKMGLELGARLIEQEEAEFKNGKEAG